MSRSQLPDVIGVLTVACGLVGAAVLDLLAAGLVAPLLLGRIVTLPIAILFGPWCGALAALIHGARRPRPVRRRRCVILPIEAIVVGCVRAARPLADSRRR